MVSSPNEPWHVPALKTCGQCKMKGPDWSEDCSCPITLRVDFVVTRTDGTAVRSHPRDRKEASIVEGNLSDWPFILQPARLKGVATG